MQMFRRMPVTLVRGEGTRVWDDNGKEYLDFVAGIATDTLGHAHPGLADVIAAQARKLIHVSNIFYSEPQVQLAQLLVENSALDQVFFVNSGAEANEGAIKLARKWGINHRNGAYEIIATHNGFHGRTMGSVAATGTPRYREPFGPELPGFSFVDFGDLAALKAATTDKTCAILLEPIQGEGGVNVPPDDYLPGVRAWCDEQGILLILDEVQTGCGRTGKLWGYEHAGVEPDIMTLAKGLGGGVPIGAVLAKSHCTVFEPGDHGSTFGGNPLATAASFYVMTQVIEAGVLENARARGEQLQQRLASLEDRFSSVAGQRGRGLLRALVFDEDIAGAVATKALEAGLILNAVRPNAVRFIPALTVTEEEIDRAVEIVEGVLDGLNS
ncbi:MAG: acetylornithine transaminase [Chloroflexi bacterium]|nr:acetylornithine transaminase [Chloroflexota bacterium]MQC48509.1 acetylornithine transaminase [Chloroflexota bacterium]